MAQPQQKGAQKYFFVAILLVIVLLGVIGYARFDSQPMTKREAIEDGIRSAKQTSELSAEEEQLLRIQLAIVDYMANNGNPPNFIDDLVPTYFDSVPRNPTTMKRFYYQRDGNRYVLRADKDESVKLAKAKKDDAGKRAKSTRERSDAEGKDETEFVNPNEMEVEQFVYDPTGKRDPFRPFDLSRRNTANSQLTPLERYELGQLRVTAILGDAAAGRSAIVENAAGRGFTVRPGTKIGDSGGVIVSIEVDRLKILETEVDFAGNEHQKVVEMKLHTAEEAEDTGVLDPDGVFRSYE